jgi:hypothetical protein
VSVYGTGRTALVDRQIFLQVRLPGLSVPPKLHGTVGFQSPYALQPPIPSGGASFTSRSLPLPQCEYRNLNRLSIGFASRLLLSPRLTLIRLTLFRKPWASGAGISIPVIVTYAYIFFSGRSSAPRDAPSTRAGMLPYHADRSASLASAAVFMPVHHLRITARLVSCYALFE